MNERIVSESYVYLGLAAKIVALVIILPGISTEWYVPFLKIVSLLVV